MIWIKGRLLAEMHHAESVLQWHVATPIDQFHETAEEVVMQAVAVGPTPNPILGTLSRIGLESIDAYIRSANRIPVLAVEEERALARRLRDHDDLNAARGLILPHLRFVVSVARDYAGYGLPHSDLIQEGNIGLMKAVRRFDPERGVRLVTFAIHWIRAEINEYVLRNWRLVRIAGTKAQRKLFFNLRSLKAGVGALSGTEVDRVATALNVKPEEVREMDMRMSGRDIAFDGDRDEDNGFAPASYLAHGEGEPSARIDVEESRRARAQGLAKALSALDQRSRHIVQARWLTEGRPAVLQDLAGEYKVSAERIRQIEVAALKKIREVIKSSGVLSAA